MGEASGAEVVRWTGESVNELIPKIQYDQPKAMADVPAAYIIPAAWTDVVERIVLHGVEVEKLSEPLPASAEVYRLQGAGIAEPSPWTPNPFEGHIRIIHSAALR